MNFEDFFRTSQLITVVIRTIFGSTVLRLYCHSVERLLHDRVNEMQHQGGHHLYRLARVQSVLY